MMTPAEMRVILLDIANKFAPITPYLKRENLTEFAVGYSALYEGWLQGKSVSLMSLDMEIQPGQEEADELEKRLNSPQAFMEEMWDCMWLGEQVGVVSEKPKHLRLVHKKN